MRVAYIVPPYAGHYKVLFPLWIRDESSHLFVLRFQNDPQITEAGRKRITVITVLGDRQSECAKEFNDYRSQQLERVLRCFLHDFNATQVVYDFFCLEARLACRNLGIPAICSIPALLKEDETHTCSDAILESEHFYWLWKHPYNVSIKPVAFMGPRDRGVGIVRSFTQNEIWVSFGTVVPRYESCQQKLEEFLAVLQAFAEKYREKDIVLYNVCFDQRFRHLSNVRQWVGSIDLVTEFQSGPPKLLIFHGGGNTYTEAMHYRVPNMLVVPFLGDQFETARRVGNIYSGDLEYDLQHLKPVDYSNIGPLDHPFQDTFSDYFRPGDLVFGQRKNRDALQANFPHLNLHLNHYKPFTDIANPDNGDLPAIADVYNDSFGKIAHAESDFHQRMSQFENTIKLRKFAADTPSDHKLVHYCIDLMMLTIENWNGKIHFILGEDPGEATQIELETIREMWDKLKDSVLFYNIHGKRIPAPFYMKNRKQRPCYEIVGVGGCNRRKTKPSENSKMQDRGLPLIDKHARRFGYITNFEAPQGWNIHVASCDLRVHYYYKAECVEVQFWPWIYLHNFQEDIRRGDPNYSDRERQCKAQDVLEGLCFSK